MIQGEIEYAFRAVKMVDVVMPTTDGRIVETTRFAAAFLRKRGGLVY